MFYGGWFWEAWFGTVCSGRGVLNSNATGGSAITDVIARGQLFDRTSTSGVRVLYHITFNNLYHFQFCWIFGRFRVRHIFNQFL